jgi:hypothetical protein
VAILLLGSAAPAVSGEEDSMRRRFVILAALLIALLWTPRHSHAAIITGAELFAPSDGEVVAKYLGEFAGFTHVLFLDSPVFIPSIFETGPGESTPGDAMSLGTFSAGDVLTFGLFVDDTLLTFYTGPGALNPDGIPHARMFTDPTNEGFDPAILALLGWVPGDIVVGFEDLHKDHPSYDADFNDLIFAFSGVDAREPSEAPEPLTLSLLGLAAAGAAVRARRSKRSAR